LPPFGLKIIIGKGHKNPKTPKVITRKRNTNTKVNTRTKSIKGRISCLAIKLAKTIQ
jgi:hypothetical protein